MTPGNTERSFLSRLKNWNPPSTALSGTFGKESLHILRRAERRFNQANRTIVFLSHENSYAALGGLAAVVSLLPRALSDNGERVVLMTPFFRENETVKNAVSTGMLRKHRPGHAIRLPGTIGLLTIYRDTASSIPSFHLDITGFFSARENPYAYADQRMLVDDACAFCAGVPVALNALGYASDILFHAHDWETALIAVTARLATIRNLLTCAKVVLTLHNSFDAGLPPESTHRFFGMKLRGETVLQCSIPLLSAPLTTVSTPFARDLRHDPLQKSVFVRHLQSRLKINPALGIENGMFGTAGLPLSATSIEKADKGDYAPLLREKSRCRTLFVKALETAVPAGALGAISFPRTGNASIPVFFMTGRLDLQQKGFDVVFHAFLKMKRGKARLFFCPTITSTAPHTSLDFFAAIARQCRGDIAIWPTRLSIDLYRTFLKGASFLVMPSFYEPFGAATEGYLNATPVLARATGGLVSQVVPTCTDAIPPYYRRIMNARWRLTGPTGILYREKTAANTARNQWSEIFSLPPEKRMSVTLYHDMVDAAYGALREACVCFKKPRLYGGLIVNGIRYLENFTWAQNGTKHKSVYDCAGRTTLR